MGRQSRRGVGSTLPRSRRRPPKGWLPADLDRRHTGFVRTPDMNDELRLQRFLDGQAPIYDDAIAMLRDGVMCTPYMDRVFPRFVGCDGAEAGNRFAIASLDEARAYLAFPVLGNRYRECLSALAWLADLDARDVFGDPDTRKLHASLTLFAAATNEPLMRTMLAIWFDNLVDEATIAGIGAAA